MDELSLLEQNLVDRLDPISLPVIADEADHRLNKRWNSVSPK
jgi:hypothetical protein